MFLHPPGIFKSYSSLRASKSCPFNSLSSKRALAVMLFCRIQSAIYGTNLGLVATEEPVGRSPFRAERVRRAFIVCSEGRRMFGASWDEEIRGKSCLQLPCALHIGDALTTWLRSRLGHFTGPRYFLLTFPPPPPPSFQPLPVPLYLVNVQTATDWHGHIRPKW